MPRNSSCPIVQTTYILVAGFPRVPGRMLLSKCWILWSEGNRKKALGTERKTKKPWTKIRPMFTYTKSVLQCSVSKIDNQFPRRLDAALYCQQGVINEEFVVWLVIPTSTKEVKSTYGFSHVMACQFCLLLVYRDVTTDTVCSADK